MALYRDIRFNLGSATDIMGAVGTVTGATFNKDKKGWALQTNNVKYIQYDKQLLPDGAFSIVIWISLDSKNLSLRINAVSDNSFLNTICPRYSSGFPFLGLGSSNSRTWDYNKYDNKYHCYIFSCNGSSQLDINNSTLFIDNLIQPILSTTNSSVQSSRNTFKFIGGGNSTTISNISRIKVYDHVLTSKEREREQIEFEAAQPLTYQKRQLQLPKPTELKQQGLIAAYNMKPVGNILHDISGNVNNGINYNCIKTHRSTKYNGISSYSDITNPSIYNLISKNNTWSINIRVLIFDTTTLQTIFNSSISGNDSTGITVVAGNIVIGIYNGTSYYTKYNSAISIGWYNISINCNSGILSVYLNNVLLTLASATPSLGTSLNKTHIGATTALSSSSNAKYSKAEVADLRIYNRLQTTQEIKAYHNSFNEVILHEKFEDMAVGSSKLPNVWIKNGGSFVCGENTANDPVIKSIRKGTKYLKCVTAGTGGYYPVKTTRGYTFEFNYYAVGLSLIDFMFLRPNSLGVGYTVAINNGGRIGLYKNSGITTNLIGETATNFISANTYYRYRIITTATQIFIYILGGIYTTWTPITNSPFTDSSYTSGNYFGVRGSLLTGERVTDILIESQIQQ